MLILTPVRSHELELSLNPSKCAHVGLRDHLGLDKLRRGGMVGPPQPDELQFALEGNHDAKL